MRTWICVVVLMIALSAVGCGKNEESPMDREYTAAVIGMPEDPAPGDGDGPYPTTYCKPESDGTFKDFTYLTHGKNDGQYDWGMGGSCIMRPIKEAWAVTHNQALMVWKKITSSNYTVRPDLPADVAYFYDVFYKVDNPFPQPDVDWKMGWYHSIKKGTAQHPRKILINYHKYFGTGYIKVWTGSIILQFVTPTITSVTMRDHISAPQTGPEDSEGTVRIVVDKIRTGDPNWAPLP